MTVRVPRQTCRRCGANLSGATSIDNPNKTLAPRPGAVSICWYCAHVTLFADDGTMREPTDDERAELVADPEVTRAVASVLLYRIENAP